MHISFNRHRSTVHVRQPLSPLGKVVFCIIFSLVGLGLLIGAYFLSRNTREFLAVSKHARGEVIDMIREESTSGTGYKRRTSSTYFPEIRFTSEDGVTVEFRGSSGSNPPSYHRGQSIDVLYNPSSPHDARINGWFELWGGRRDLLRYWGSLLAYWHFTRTILWSGFVRGKQVFAKIGNAAAASSWVMFLEQPLRTRRTPRDAFLGNL